MRSSTEVGHGLRQPAHLMSHTLTNTSTYRLTTWRPSLNPSQPELTGTAKNPLFFFFLGRGQFPASWHREWNQLASRSDKRWSWSEGIGKLTPSAGSLPPDQTGTYWKPQPRELEYSHLSKDSDPFKTVL